MSAQALIEKKFVIYFGEKFPSGEDVKLVSRGFFTEVNGFRPEEIQKINELEVDEAFVIPVSDTCKIWRVG